MARSTNGFANISVDQISLDLNNPRHEPLSTQAEVIEYLCRNADIDRLVRDIVEHGVNPLGRFGVKTSKKGGSKPQYIVFDGNRRLCALMLLREPELAPSSLRKNFEDLSNGWTPVDNVECWICDDEEIIKHWLRRQHHGYDGGVGQKPWEAEQKAQHSGKRSRNAMALALLNWAQGEGLIGDGDRKGKITTIQRYLGNAVVRTALSIDSNDPEKIAKNWTDEKSKVAPRLFIKDVMQEGSSVNSRNDAKSIGSYARELMSRVEAKKKDVQSEVPQTPEVPPVEVEAPRKFRKIPPKHLQEPESLSYNEKIFNKLKRVRMSKARNIYYSICRISLNDHAPLLAIGIWALMEIIAKRMGSGPNISFRAYLSKKKLQDLGFNDERKIRVLSEVLQRVQDSGNTTKHDEASGTVDRRQLENDWETLDKLLLACIKSIEEEQ